MKVLIKYSFVIFAVLINSCKHKTTVESANETDASTPVTVTSVSLDPLEAFVELNATATFLQKSYVKSNLTGYIKAVHIQYAASVNAGQSLFTLKTKESDAIGNSINNLDPGFRFSGVNIIRAGTGGYVSELNHQAGDYVQDGEQLAVISNINSFVFVMNVPYEYKQYISNNKEVQLTLPDGERILGKIQTSMPFMDSVSQTQSVAIRVTAQRQIPQNLVASVKLITVLKPSAASLPKAAVLTNDTQSEFWVMKMINDSTAVKVFVKKGIETGERVEIEYPAFNPGDKIVLTGNYGLPDTAKVKLEAPPSKEKQ